MKTHEWQSELWWAASSFGDVAKVYQEERSIPSTETLRELLRFVRCDDVLNTGRFSIGSHIVRDCAKQQIQKGVCALHAWTRYDRRDRSLFRTVRLADADGEGVPPLESWEERGSEKLHAHGGPVYCVVSSRVPRYGWGILPVARREC